MPGPALWRGERTIHPRQLRSAKVVLVALIAVTSLPPLTFVRPDDASAAVNVYKYLAKTGPWSAACC